jgi:hypothetical protein
MSKRSSYLRDQAQKCMHHAQALSDAYTQGELRNLASQYIVEAAEIEAREKDAGAHPPTLWLPSRTPQHPDAEFPTG